MSDMAEVDGVSALAPTLYHSSKRSSTHRAVLLRNALQSHMEKARLNIGSPTPNSSGDMTLCSTLGVRTRVDELQPENDPFVVDNIFKSPKKRRRGLLSWSTAQPADATTAAQSDRQAFAAPFRDFQRHVRARSRRRSILSSKYSLSSMRRRNAGSIAKLSVIDHTRSASEPTFTLATVSRASSSSTCCKSGDLSPSLQGSPCPSSPSSLPSSTATILSNQQCRRHTHKPSYPPPTGSSPSNYRQSESACRAMPSQSSTTLRGVPGHPAPCVTRSRPTPYISFSALRLASQHDTVLRAPAAVAIRDATGQRPQRCSSFPSSSAASVQKKAVISTVFPLSMRNPPQCISKDCLITSSPFQVPRPVSKFDTVKNSLDLIKGAPPSTDTSTLRLSTDSTEGQGDDTSPLSKKLWPAAFSLLRRIADCGWYERKRP